MVLYFHVNRCCVTSIELGLRRLPATAAGEGREPRIITCFLLVLQSGGGGGGASVELVYTQASTQPAMYRGSGEGSEYFLIFQYGFWAFRVRTRASPASSCCVVTLHELRQPPAGCFWQPGGLETTEKKLLVAGVVVWWWTRVLAMLRGVAFVGACHFSCHHTEYVCCAASACPWSSIGSLRRETWGHLE